MPLSIVASIILVDLVLSGDNALLIGAAMTALSMKQRLVARLSGGATAIALRITFTLGVTKLLQIPYVHAVGGGVLVLIALRLLVNRTHKNQKPPYTKSGLGAGLITILVADASSCVDNVLSVGALANGNTTLLIFGLVISMLCLLPASALIATVMERWPLLLDGAWYSGGRPLRW
jgi:YjbE family integral membrane protein